MGNAVRKMWFQCIIKKAGLQISQNGGKLLIKNGDYTADAWHDVKLLKDGATLEIIGESSSDCCLR